LTCWIADNLSQSETETSNFLPWKLQNMAVPNNIGTGSARRWSIPASGGQAPVANLFVENTAGLLGKRRRFQARSGTARLNLLALRPGCL